MNSTTSVPTRLRSWCKEHRAELSLCLRVTSSGVLTLMVAQLLHLRFSLWAVLTAVLLTQLNVGRSLKATADYLAGTLGGAIFAGVVGTLIPHNNDIGLAAVLAIALAPVALLAAVNARFSAAPLTAVLVLVAPIVTHLGSFASAFERVVEVAVGCIMGLVVSFAVFPARAHDEAIHAAAHMLDLTASALPKLLGGVTRGVDEVVTQRIFIEIDEAYAKLQAAAAECVHERMSYLSRAPDISSLLPAVRRLRDELAIMARIAAVPLPEAFHARLEPALARVNDAAAAYLRASGDALAGRKPATRRPALDEALDGYAAEMAALRRQHLGQDASAHALERALTLAFTLEQLRQVFSGLEACIAEHSTVRMPTTRRP